MDIRFENLNKSIMFNLSLSSKELFHSNLLGYLFRYDVSLFGKIVGNKNLKVSDVRRERKNIDIELTDNSGNKYLVENKVKDIIGCAQLDEINRKNPNHAKYYLFSLLGNNLENLEKKYPDWEEVGYKQVVKILGNHTFKDNTVNIIKEDYCSFMSDMIGLLEDHYSSCDRYMLHSKGNGLLDQYVSVRLHDVYQKYGASHFVNHFRQKFPHTDIKSDYGYVKTGIIDFWKEFRSKKRGKFTVLIQLENGEYRKAVVGERKHEEAFLKEFESIGWFDAEWRSPRNLRYRSYENKNGTKMWFQIPETVNDMDYDVLSEKIKKDLDNIRP